MKANTIIALTTALFMLNSIALSQTRRESEDIIINEKGDTTRTKTITIYTEEEIAPPQHMLYLDPFSFFINYNIGYMQMVSSKVAFGGALILPAAQDVSGMAIELEGRVYPGGKGLGGFYVAPRFTYSTLRIRPTNDVTVALAGFVGWQWFPANDFGIGLGVGYERFFSRIDDGENNSLFGVYGNGRPAIRFDIGYVW